MFIYIYIYIYICARSPCCNARIQREFRVAGGRSDELLPDDMDDLRSSSGKTTSMGTARGTPPPLQKFIKAYQTANVRRRERGVFYAVPRSMREKCRGFQEYC